MRMVLVGLIAVLASLGLARADEVKPPANATPANATSARIMRAPTGPQRLVTVGKRVIEAPPVKPGCYAHIAGRWVERACLSPEIRAHLPHPDPFALNQNVQSGVQQISGGELDINLVRYGGETDPQNGGPDQFSLQLNTSIFRGDNGHLDWVQFVFQRGVVQGQQQNVLCIWNIDLTVAAASNPVNSEGYSNDGCIGIDVVRAPQAGDEPYVTGWTSQGALQTVALLPWATGSGGDTPDAFATSASDQYGLAAGTNWSQINGGFLGMGGSSHATLTRTCATENLNFGLEDWLTSNTPPPYPTPVAGIGGNTGESSNLSPVNTPLGFCHEGTCQATFDQVSSDWKTTGRDTCYPQDKPVAPLPPSGPQVFEDDGTTIAVMGETVHVCANNALLIGLDAGHNRFLCSTTLPAAGSGANGNPLIVDSSTRASFTYGGASHSVHVCPTNMVMVGYGQSQDWLICGPDLPSGYVELAGFGKTNVDVKPNETSVPEPNHTSDTMHACDPQGSGGPLVLRGLSVSDNAFICFNAGVTARLQ